MKTAGIFVSVAESLLAADLTTSLSSKSIEFHGYGLGS